MRGALEVVELPGVQGAPERPAGHEYEGDRDGNEEVEAFHRLCAASGRKAPHYVIFEASAGGMAGDSGDLRELAPGVKTQTGRLDSSALEVAEDGSFEILLAPERPAGHTGNFISTRRVSSRPHPDAPDRPRERFAEMVSGRQLFCDWEHEDAIHLQLALAGPDSVPCDCVPNPYRLAEAPTLFAIVDIGYRFVGVVLAIAIAIRLLLRWVRGSVPARAVAFLMPVALLSWVSTLATQMIHYATGTPPNLALDTVSLIAMASVPVCFVAGISHARNMRARVADLMRITREGADGSHVQVTVPRRVQRGAFGQA